MQNSDLILHCLATDSFRRSPSGDSFSATSDVGELPGFWCIMAFRHAPILRKGSGNTTATSNLYVLFYCFLKSATFSLEVVAWANSNRSYCFTEKTKNCFQRSSMQVVYRSCVTAFQFFFLIEVFPFSRSLTSCNFFKCFMAPILGITGLELHTCET